MQLQTVSLQPTVKPCILNLACVSLGDVSVIIDSFHHAQKELKRGTKKRSKKTLIGRKTLSAVGHLMLHILAGSPCLLLYHFPRLTALPFQTLYKVPPTKFHLNVQTPPLSCNSASSSNSRTDNETCSSLSFPNHILLFSSSLHRPFVGRGDQPPSLSPSSPGQIFVPVSKSFSLDSSATSS